MGSPRTYRTRAIVLDKTKLKETDLILTLVGESGRQIRAVAKGARKPGSRLAARCDLCCEVDLLLARGRSLDIVSQAELLTAPLGSQPDYELLLAASAAAEVAGKCTYEDLEDPYVYPITRAVLAQMRGADVPHRDVLLAAYIFKLLSHMGYRPDYSACVACEDERPTHFSAMAGGLVCASCAATVPGCELLEPQLIAWLESLISLRFNDLASAAIDPHTAARLLSLSHLWAVTHLDCRLRALEFLLGC